MEFDEYFHNANELMKEDKYNEALKILLDVSENLNDETKNSIIITAYSGIAFCYSNISEVRKSNLFINKVLDTINLSCNNEHKILQYKAILPLFASCYMINKQYKECYRIGKLYLSLLNKIDSFDSNFMAMIDEAQNVILKI